LKTVQSIEGFCQKRFKCRVEGHIDCPNLKDKVVEYTTVTLDITPNLTKDDIQDLVKNQASINILYRLAEENSIMPEYVFWHKSGSGNRDVTVTILKSWVVPIEIEGEEFTQFALDL
jgi:hypothetical protein